MINKNISAILAAGGAAAVQRAADHMINVVDVGKLGAAKALSFAIDDGTVTLDAVLAYIKQSAALVVTASIPLNNPQPAFPAASAAVASRAESLALQANQTIVGLQTQIMRLDQEIKDTGSMMATVSESARQRSESSNQSLNQRQTVIEAKAEAAANRAAQAEATAAAALAEAVAAIAAAGAFKPDPSAVALAVSDAVAAAFKPFVVTVEAAGAQAAVGAMVSARVIGSATALAVFGVNIVDRAGDPVMVDLWDAQDAPAVDPCFIWSDAIVRHLLLSQATGENLWFGGEKGTGKSETARQFAARTGRGYCRINFNKHSAPEDFLGATGLVNGATEFQPQSFLRAFTAPGTVILLDEPTNSDPGVLAPLNSLLEAGSVTTIGNLGWRRAPGVVVFAADNTLTNGDDSGRYAGTKQMNSALADRFARIVRFDFLPIDQEVEAVARHTGCTFGLARHVIGAVTLAREKVSTGDIVDAPSIRSIVAYIRALKLLSPSEAWATCIAARQPTEGAAALEAIRIAAIDESLILKSLKGI
jgi:MoxR-like ATPase